MSHRSPDSTPSPLDALASGHLAPERLAALVDEPPAPAEVEHLAACAACRREAAAQRALHDRVRLERDRVAPPLTRWDSLGAALRAEGLVQLPEIATVPGDAPVVLPIARGAAATRRWPARLARQAAAALLLVGGGLVVGRASAGADPVPGLAFGGATSAASAVERVLADSASAPVSTDEAMAILTRAERDYRVATAYLAGESASAGAVDRPEVYQRRLAVMDEVAALTRAALAEAPHDPALNQFYLASLGAREATLRSLATTLPADAQLSRF